MAINKNFLEIVESLRNYVLNQAPYLDTKEGSPWTTCFIEPQASELERLYYLIDFVMANQSMLSAQGKYLDTLAANVGLSRNKAVPATGTVTFYSSAPVGEDVVIPVGTIVSTTRAFNIPAVDFETTQKAVMSKGTMQVDAPVRCLTAGSIGNLGEHQVNNLSSSLYMVSYVDNDSAMTGGVDVETDRAFYYRIRSTIFKNSAGTEAGYLGAVLEQTGATAAKVIKPEDGDPYSRGPGTVDIIVKGANIQVYTDYVAMEDPYLSYSLSKQPVTDLPNTINVLAGSGLGWSILGTYYGGTEPVLYGSQDFTFYRGPKIACNNFENSIYGSDGLLWMTTATGWGGAGLTDGTRTAMRPPDGYVFKVQNYSYDKMVEDGQAEVDLTKCVTADAIVRKSEIQTLNFNISFVVNAGYDWIDTKNFIVSDVIGFVSNNYNLGAKLEFSDIMSDVREKVAGVDNIFINSVVVVNEANVIVGTHTRDIQFDSVTAVTVGTLSFDNRIVYNAQT